MFHVKHRPFAPLAVVIAALVLATGCIGDTFSQPSGWASPVDAGEVLLVQSERGRLDALEFTASGALVERWHYPISDDEVQLDAIYATPLVEGGVVYLAGYSGDVVALSVATGRPLPAWGAPVRLDGHIVATPAFDGERLYVATDRGRVSALDASSGRVADIVLDPAGEHPIWGDPVLVGGTLYVADIDRTVHAVGVASGGARWTQPLGGGVPAPLALDREVLIAGSLDSRLYALDAGAGGSELWSFEGDGWFWSRPLVAGGSIYAPTSRGTVYAIDRASGAERWSFASGGSQIRTALALVDGVLVAADKDGAVVGLNPSSGAVLWRSTIDGDILADPLVRGPEVLYLTTGGDVVRVHPQDGRVEELTRLAPGRQDG